MSNDNSNVNINVGSIIALIVGSPIAMILLSIFGLFTLEKFVVTLTNPLFFFSCLAIVLLLYVIDALSVKTAVYGGLGIGFLFWIMGISGITQGWFGAFCSFPILGQFVCGGVVLGSMFIDLPGFILSGVVISGFIGLFIVLVKQERKKSKR